MIETTLLSEGVRAVDHASREVSISGDDWVATDNVGNIDRPVDATLTANTSQIRLSSVYVLVQSSDGDQQFELGNDTGPLELPKNDYILNIDSSIKTYVSFSGSAVIRKTADFEDLIVSFNEPKEVTIGFRSRHDQPAGTITVDDSPEGVATAISYLHSAIKTTSPDKSFPTLRGHPPRIKLGETIDIPDVVEKSVTTTDIEIVVPPDYDSLYIVSPLAYYLQASVTVSDRSYPVIRSPDETLYEPLPSFPDLQQRCAELLRHVFYMDCLVRHVGPHGTTLSELDIWGSLPLDPEQLYHAEPVERARQYLTVPPEEITDTIPEWHLATYVDPVPDHSESLPYLLNQLSLIYHPSTSELSSKELLDLSLDDFYRASEPTAEVDLVKPELQHGRVHGWLANGIPVEVFKTNLSAYENQLDYLGSTGDQLDVTVVLNDDSMDSEQDDVANIYRTRAEELPMNVSLHSNLSPDELAEIFEQHQDFVHYIGHCDEAGLRCSPGHLSVEDIPTSQTQTFFLNACGSYYEGQKLLEKGSVAGAVTFQEVLEKQAAKVGTTFARLLIHGFSFARAIDLARRRIMTGKDYAIVGDGSYQLTQTETLVPHLYEVDISDGKATLTADAFTAWATGGIYYVAVPNSETDKQLCGNLSEYSLTIDELEDFLARTSYPIIYDNNFYWTTELLEELR